MLDELWKAQQAELRGAEFQPGNLSTKFIEPPFTVLDTRQGRWQERRRAWLSLGIKSELGRGADLLSLSPAEEARDRWERDGADVKAGKAASFGEDLMRGKGSGQMQKRLQERVALERQNKPGYREQAALRSGDGRELVAGKGNARSDFGAYLASDGVTSTGAGAAATEPAGGTSIFDPVLCELMYRWFAPPEGQVLDPFAGGSVRGIVAAKLGHPYTGIDLSLAQLEANRAQAAAILAPSEQQPLWLHGDSRTMEDLLPAGQRYDMVMSCPPYFDLEVYSDDSADLSNAGDYEVFLVGYADVIARAAARLLPDRFMVLVVSEVRDPAGYCRGLVPDTIAAARAAGLRLYNEAVLVNSAGSLPLRVTKYMESSRKLGRAHQNILCFIKGKPPRGWSYDRAAPPSPQLGFGLAEPVPAAAPASLPAPQPAPAEAPAVAPAGGPADPAQQRPSVAVEPPEEETAEWVADVEGMPQDAVELVQVDDGRWADVETGELFADDGAGQPGEPVPPLVPAATPAPYVPQVIAAGPGWACSGCGSTPEVPLTATVIDGMARGECGNCGREKVFRRVR